MGLAFFRSQFQRCLVWNGTKRESEGNWTPHQPAASVGRDIILLPFKLWRSRSFFFRHGWINMFEIENCCSMFSCRFIVVLSTTTTTRSERKMIGTHHFWTEKKKRERRMRHVCDRNQTNFLHAISLLTNLSEIPKIFIKHSKSNKQMVILQ